MFNKPRKNFRSRQVSENSEDEKEDDDDVIIESFMPAHLQKTTTSQTGDKPKKAKKKKDKSQGVPKTNSTLSFADDEHVDSEEFKVRKSSHSRKVAKMLKRRARREQEEAELQKELASNSPESTSKDSQNGLDPVDMEMGSDVEFPDSNSENERSEEDFGAPSQSRPVHAFSGQKFRDMISDGQIPDATMIHLAKKRRQQARERGDDFIPIDEARAEKKGTSRLVREDDYDCSDEEERLDMITTREQEVRKIQNTILEAEQGSHSEGSDQEREWEEQQIRKGVQAGVAAQGEIDETSKQYQQFFFGNVPPSSYTNLPPSNGSTSLTPNIVTTRKAPPSNLPPITIDVIKKRLMDRLEELTSVHRAHSHELRDIESRMENCSLDINNQTGTKGGLEDRYRFFQQMRG